MISKTDIKNILTDDLFNDIKGETGYKKCILNTFIKELNRNITKWGYDKETITSLYNSYNNPLEFQEDLELLTEIYQTKNMKGVRQVAKQYAYNRY